MNLVRNLTVLVSKTKALETLRTNRANHSDIVAEARAGYVEQAREAISSKLEQLLAGKVVSLAFKLTPPQDYTRVYTTAITMLELHQGDTIELDGDQVRHLMMDEWDWMDSFLVSNSRYSNAATAYAVKKGSQ